MRESRKAKNCEVCRTRMMAEKYLGEVFDYKNCPFVCVQNRMYDRLYTKEKKISRRIIYG